MYITPNQTPVETKIKCQKGIGCDMIRFSLVRATSLHKVNIECHKMDSILAISFCYVSFHQNVMNEDENFSDKILANAFCVNEQSITTQTCVL